jgi:hypothetical protein
MAMRQGLRTRALRPLVELLEPRIALSITIAFDYSHDTSGFFSANPIAETLLQQAGQSLGSQLNNHLAAITPDPAARNTWTLSPPFTGSMINPSLPADTILVEVVGTALGPSAFAGEGGPSGYSDSGSSDWLNLVGTRGGNSSNSAILGGGINFNTTEGWFTKGVFNQPFFYGVALHELGHVLGLGTAQAWKNFVDSTNNTFIGPQAESAYGAPVPLDASSGDSANDAHWAEADRSDGQAPVMVPIYAGTQAFTSLDWAGLSDVGWSVDHNVVDSPRLTFASEPPTTVVAGGGFGLTISVENPSGQVDAAFNGPVILSLAGNPDGATLDGTLKLNASSGLVTFTGLSVNEAGAGYTIVATAAGLAGTTSSVFTVSPADSSSSSPTIIGALVLTTGKGKRNRVAGFELIFSEPLAASRALNRLNYRMTETIKLGRKTVNRAVKFSVRYAGGSNRVDLFFAGEHAFARGGRIGVIAALPGGVTDTSGDPLTGNTTLFILPGARGLIL